jgi:hypothetical protein
LVEVVVSLLLVLTVAGGALAALESSDRAVAEERHRAQAHAVGEEDQARLRSMRISDLANLVQGRTVTVDGTPYEVRSRGDFVTDSTGTESCTRGTASADYIRITSIVTWPSMGSRPPVLVQSTVAPPNGSISEDHGALAVSVQDAAGNGIPGVGLVGTGAGSFSGETSENGCVIFGNLPEGNYTLTPSVSTGGLVDKDGNPPGPIPTSVVGLSTNTVALQYDVPGSIDVSFTTFVGGSLIPSNADSIIVFNTGMTAAEAFGQIGTPQTSVTASQLFPFASPNTIYAGACEGNNPDPNDDNPAAAPALASVLVPPGGSATASIQLPALHLTVFSGSSSSTPGLPVANARVTVTDDNCSISGTPVKRTFGTNALGQLPNRGLPWSRYDICADNGVRRSRALTSGVNQNQNVNVQNLTAGTTVNVYLSGSTNSQAGTCP